MIAMFRAAFAWRLLPWVVAGSLSAVAGVYAYGHYKHNHGYNAGEVACEASHAAAEVEVIIKYVEIEKKKAKIDLKAIVVAATRRQAIEYTVRAIPRPSNINDFCATDECLRFFNEGVRGANSGTNTD